MNERPSIHEKFRVNGTELGELAVPGTGNEVGNDVIAFSAVHSTPRNKLGHRANLPLSLDRSWKRYSHSRERTHDRLLEHPPIHATPDTRHREAPFDATLGFNCPTLEQSS